MAVETRTIGSTGKNYSTLAAWHAAVNLNSGSDIWKGTHDANEDLNESLVFDVDGTSATSYVWLTTTEANRHAGVWDTGKARNAYTGGDTAVYQVEADWVRIDWQQIHRPDSGFLGNSDEGIRLTSSCSNVLISYSLLWTDDGTTNDTDGIYIGTAGTYSLSVDNCVIYGWNRGCLHEQMTSTGAGNTLTLNLDHNTFLFGGESGGGTNEEAPLAIRQDDNSHTITAYNNVFKAQNAGAGTDDLYFDNGVAETTTLTGSHNCYDNVNDQTAGTLTNNWTSTAAATAGVVETDTANAVIITETTRDSTFDATPQDLANNVLLDAGTDRQGSEPDSRQDFSVAVNGARGTTNVDIGAFQISSGGTTASAEAATGTGTGSDATVAVAVSAEAASGTGTGSDATIAVGVTANAEAASGTGTGSDATVAVAVAAEAAAGTGTGSDATVGVGAQAEAATGTGTGSDATVSTDASTTASAEVASGTGTGSDATAAVAVNAEAASGTGTGSDATVAVGVTANAEAASGTGTGSDATIAVAVSAEAASGTGTGSDATVSTSADTTANAEAATGTGTGSDATIAVAVNAEAASGTGTGSDATVSTSSETTASAEVASGTGTGSDATIAITATAEAATGTGTGSDATVSTAAETTANAEAASGTGTGSDATIAVTATAEAATGTGTGSDATAVAGAIGDATAEAASGTGTGHDATISAVGTIGDPGMTFAGLVRTIRAETRTERHRRAGAAPLCPHSNHRMIRHGVEWVCEFDGYRTRSL